MRLTLRLKYPLQPRRLDIKLLNSRHIITATTKVIIIRFIINFIIIDLSTNRIFFQRFNLPYILVYCSFSITQNSEIISISTSHISSITQIICTILTFFVFLYICLIKNFIAMKNFELKKYFGNLIGLPTTAPKKGVSLIRKNSK